MVTLTANGARVRNANHSSTGEQFKFNLNKQTIYCLLTVQCRLRLLLTTAFAWGIECNELGACDRSPVDSE